MCGLVGVAGDTQLKLRDVFIDLLFADTVRGEHSTGAAAIDRMDNSVKMEKAPLPGWEFVRTKEFKKLMEAYTVKALIGHNRYATVGAKTASNAHPFAFENVVGAHNGTIDKFAQAELDDWKLFGTDSEAIYNSINIYGLKETVGKLTGAWALTFFEKSSNTINLLRNNKRPLFYAMTDDMESVLWASEAPMLAWIVQRNNIKLADNKIYECEPDLHYRWTLPKKFGDKLSKPICVKVEGFKGTYSAPVHVQHRSQNTEYYGYWPLGDDMNEDEPEVVKATSAPETHVVTQGGPQNFSLPGKNTEPKHIPHKASSTKLRPKLDTKKFRPPYKDHLCKVLNKIAFTSLVKTGCVYCEVKDQEWGEFIKILRPDLDGRRVYLCEDCYNTDDIRELVEATLP